MWVFVVIGYLLLVGLAAWFGGGAVMTVAAGGFVLAVALWLLEGLLVDLLRGPMRWLAKPFRAPRSSTLRRCFSGSNWREAFVNQGLGSFGFGRRVV